MEHFFTISVVWLNDERGLFYFKSKEEVMKFIDINFCQISTFSIDKCLFTDSFHFNPTCCQ